MHPIFHILGRDVPGYGLMGLFGFAACALLILWSCRRHHFSLDDALYIYAWSLLGMIAGAKILFTVVSFREIVVFFATSHYSLYDKVYAYLQGGMVFYGGLLGAVAGAFASARYFHVSMERAYPVMIPAIPLFAGFGRLGCLMAGCCYGRETSSPLHIIFTESDYAPNGVPLIPTQLYEALFDFALCAVLVYLGRKERYKCAILRIYLVSYAIFRFILEFFRGDSARGVHFLSTSQWISLAVLAVVCYRMLRHPLRRESAAEQ